MHQMMIPFSPPRIDEEIITEVNNALRSGWITTGPRTKEFERQLAVYCNVPAVLCLNSATAGLELMLRWFGVKQGDEVILPAYTYAATANVIMHCGAKPVFVDVNEVDFNISVEGIKKAISSKTKVIMPVDFAGMPCDYELINSLADESKKIFNPCGEEQKKLGRILVLSDSAHSLGSIYKSKRSGGFTDISVFSFHAVKNLITAEGGAVALNLPAPFDNAELYKQLCVKSLHGQNKDALAKTQKGNWKYDIVEAGYKYNMTDMAAAIGLVELKRYNNDTIKKRKYIFEKYTALLSQFDWAQTPVYKTNEKESSYHVYALRIKNITESQRDAMIQEIFNSEVSVNVHFIPVPMMSFYKNEGYSITHYPITYNNFMREISLPVFYDISDEQIELVVKAVVQAYKKVITE